MAKRRLPPIEYSDLSGGLDTYTAQTLTPKNKMSVSENIRHSGRGRIVRRNGTKKFSNESTATQLIVATPDLSPVGRLLVPLGRVTENTLANYAIEALSVIRQEVRSATNTNGILSSRKVPLVDDSSKYSSPVVSLAYDVFSIDLMKQTVHNSYLDNRIYVGTDLHFPVGSVTPGGFTSRDNEYPFGYVLDLTGGTIVVNDVITCTGSTALGVVGQIDTGNGPSYILYNWNGVSFSGTIEVNTVPDGGITIDAQNEIGQAGIIIDIPDSALGNVPKYVARRWGIRAPIQEINVTETNTAGSLIEVPSAGPPSFTYDIKYTFIRTENAVLSTGENPRLTSGQIISESAPSPVNDFINAAVARFEYTIPSLPVDPQITHLRVYRTDSFTQDFKHVMDIPIASAVLPATNIDNFKQITIQFEQVQPETDFFKVFGENGENSGDIIEVLNHRVFVSGNDKFRTTIYISSPRIEHKFSEYFSTSLVINESPGERIRAMKAFSNRIFVFLENSVYSIRDAGSSSLGVDSYEVVTRQFGCVMKNGALDMGNFLIVMTRIGLMIFDGVNFSKVPLTLGVDRFIGRDFGEAIMTKGDDLIYLITPESRTQGVMVTIKHSDNTFALGLDRFNSLIQLPERFGYVQCLKNFGNSVDDGEYLMFLSQRFVSGSPDSIAYRNIMYDLKGQNFDNLTFDLSASDNYSIISKLSPGAIDFGSFAEANLEEVIAFMVSSGDEDSSEKSPTGEWEVQIYVNQGDDGTAERYDSAILKRIIKRNKNITLGQGPIQTKYVQPFTASKTFQDGGVWSSSGINPAGVFADKKQILFRAGIVTESIGRIFNILFVYKAKNNFELTNFAMRFVLDQEP